MTYALPLDYSSANTSNLANLGTGSFAFVSALGQVAYADSELMDGQHKLQSVVSRNRVEVEERSISNQEIFNGTKSEYLEMPAGVVEDSYLQISSPRLVQIINSQRPARIRLPTYQIIEQWEGRVVAIADATFDVELIAVDRRTGQRKVEKSFFTTFDKSEISSDDFGLFRVGALLMFTIGYEDMAGRRTRMMRIVFRRVPSLSKQKIEELDLLAVDDLRMLKDLMVDGGE